MSAQHTPGACSYDPTDRTISGDGAPRARCYADRDEHVYGPLFAAAPELLAALEGFMEACRVDGIPQGWGLFEHNARAAIAKARGAA